MKRYLFLLIMAAVTLLLYLWSPKAPEPQAAVYEENKGQQLLLPRHNVAIAVLDLNKAGLSLTRAADLPLLRDLQKDFSGLAGVEKVESLLNAARVISENDDIIVSRAIPEDNTRVTDAYLVKLSREIRDFPELTPFVNINQDTLLFYIYFGNKTPAFDIHRDLNSLKEKWSEKLPFDFTGKAPILAETEALLTDDIVLFFPLLAIMVIAVLSLFRSFKVVAVSLVLILIAIGGSYGFVRFLGIPDSPLLLLVPVFSLGLLSDYLIHYFYHHFYTPGLKNNVSLRKKLIFPLSLTALSTITGFLSLSLINGSGHLQLGILITAAVIITWFGVFFWLPYQKFPEQAKPLMKGLRNALGRFFVRLVKIRPVIFAVIAAGVIWGAFQFGNLSIEPYPIEQLPDSTTIKKAGNRINEEFYGTLPFFIEVDTGEKMGILKKETLLELDRIHEKMESAPVGYSYSLLTVLKRMHYYFMGSEETLLTSTEYDDSYDALIEQYLLYFSSSVDPLEYESLLNNSYRIFSIKGLIYYRNYQDLSHFISLINEIKKDFPQGWSLNLHGMAKELENEHFNLQRNWIAAFLGGSFMIFVTVLLFYRRWSLALISLVPGILSMILSIGFISLAGISIDAFSIIFVAIITGLVIDYSIHILVALENIRNTADLEESFNQVVGYSGIPVFLSFITSLLSFLVLLLSSFRGARSLGFLMITSLVLSFSFSLYLIPLIILPGKLKKEKRHA